MAAPSGAAVDISQAMVVAEAPLADWLVIAPVAYCLMAGAGLMMLRKYVKLQPRLAVFGLLALVAMTAGLLVHVLSGGTVTVTMGRWLPPFGISFSVDILGAILAFTASLVALACGLYAAQDVDKTGRRYGFYPLLFLMMAGVIGAFVTGDIFNLYVWFEVLLIASFGLQILGSERQQLDGATKYALLNLVATTIFLIATGFLYGIFGTLNMADIALQAREMGATAPLYTLAALYLLAFGMKAAAFPVAFWLPASYHTPKVVVSALFAGLLTKVGIYALLRTMIMLFPEQRDELATLIAIVAVVTMILGTLGALAQTDYRRLLGYLVVSGIGVMLAGIALATPLGLSGSIFYALHSIIVMTALYMAAGMAARIGRSFSIAQLGGIYRSHVLFAAISLVLFLSVSGLPPFSGFWPKAVLVKASLDAGIWWLAASILVTGFLTTIAVGRVWAHAYWKPADTTPPESPMMIPTATLRPSATYLPLIGLVALTAVFGLYPEPLLVLTERSAEQLLDPGSYIQSVFPEAAQ
ncbi:Na+/H+ antiporter subunit D [Pararhizobium haloflavum]|uniref:Na+/H+ antiporter subunit D n=1 Tax=Pararhizobium haloflavum TaxID=2037914 RepID=UPI000C175BCA|nr:Na+/H+ antiporter subunit D [Pararhizobium haloflavum]